MALPELHDDGTLASLKIKWMTHSPCLASNRRRAEVSVGAYDMDVAEAAAWPAALGSTFDGDVEVTAPRRRLRAAGDVTASGDESSQQLQFMDLAGLYLLWGGATGILLLMALVRAVQFLIKNREAVHRKDYFAAAAKDPTVMNKIVSIQSTIRRANARKLQVSRPCEACKRSDHATTPPEQ